MTAVGSDAMIACAADVTGAAVGESTLFWPTNWPCALSPVVALAVDGSRETAALALGCTSIGDVPASRLIALVKPTGGVRAAKIAIVPSLKIKFDHIAGFGAI